ncbi:MAG: hypothetical protein IJE08_08425 [Clostridia bacterium]|nr:hypothetical protein [Clostridia bacterium]
MKKTKKPVCPGCSRHCAADALRCKRGRAYFEKLERKAQESALPKKAGECKKHACKWERLVSESGVVRTLFTVSRALKRNLKSGECTEAQLTGKLSPEEAHQLELLLNKLQSIPQKENFSGEM